MIEIFILNLTNSINCFTNEFSFSTNLQLENKIGEGSFAEIFIARETVSRKLRCVKRINKDLCEEKGELSYISN